MRTIHQLHCAAFFFFLLSDFLLPPTVFDSTCHPFLPSDKVLSLLSVMHHLWLERFTFKFLFHWDRIESAQAICRLMAGGPSIKVILTLMYSCPVPPQYVQRRQQENAQRQSRGEPPLPEEDLTKLFKPPQPPPRMDSLLIAGQFAPQPHTSTFFLQDH